LFELFTRMKYLLETERLRLRELAIEDTGFVIELLNSPGWLQFIGDRNVRTEEQARKYLENGPLKSYKDNGFGLSLVETKTDGLKIGMCGILKRETLQNPDIGFAFLPAFIGKGYGFEIASATLNHATRKLKLPTICAITNPDNEKSIRLLEKIGLKFVQTFQFPDSTETLSMYRS
jgi:RimJ/RimL family protein N-acetyltransferase